MPHKKTNHIYKGISLLWLFFLPKNGDFHDQNSDGDIFPPIDGHIHTYRALTARIGLPKKTLFLFFFKPTSKMGSVGAEICARWEKFTKKHFLQIHTLMSPKFRFHTVFTFGAMFCQL
jgi:hypothetical protein